MHDQAKINKLLTPSQIIRNIETTVRESGSPINEKTQKMLNEALRSRREWEELSNDDQISDTDRAVVKERILNQTLNNLATVTGEKLNTLASVVLNRAETENDAIRDIVNLADQMIIDGKVHKRLEPLLKNLITRFDNGDVSADQFIEMFSRFGGVDISHAERIIREGPKKTILKRKQEFSREDDEEEKHPHNQNLQNLIYC